MQKSMRDNFSVFVLAFALVILSGAFGTALATTTSTISVGGTDYTLFTGFTATGRNGTNYRFRRRHRRPRICGVQR